MPNLTPSQYFPPAETADEEGFLGVGGELSREWLVDAYRHGIFPWPWDENPKAPIPWFSPDPRAVLPLDDRFHVPRRLRRTCRSRRFHITFNRAMPEVMHACMTQADRIGKTWIFEPMIDAYSELHRHGVVGSVEVWSTDEIATDEIATDEIATDETSGEAPAERLVGGLYGVAIGGLFSAESMFYAARDASKVALVALVDRLREFDFQLLDIQQMTPHMNQFGAIEIPRTEYLSRLAEVLHCSARPFVCSE